MKHRCSGIAEMIPDLGLEREGAPCQFQYWSFSFSIIPSKEIPGLISFRMVWLDPYLLSSETTAKGTGLAESAGKEDPVECLISAVCVSRC